MTFVSNIAAIRKRARKHIEEGAVTPSYGTDRETVLKHLNEVLATEIVCVLRCRRHYFMAQGLLAEAIKQEFLTHAQEEQGHADQIAERIAIESYREMIEYMEQPRTGSIAEALK
ncbi:MAG: ferritin-like domain-containing protein [Steroidobacterales bacterium]